jgi:predicted HD phosphohydrolase
MDAATIDRQFPAHIDSTFTPQAISAMSHALQGVCETLQIRTPEDRSVIATRILDLARTGVIDGEALRDRVLLEATLPLF